MTLELNNSPSRNLRKYGQYQLGLQIFLAVVALAFCFAAAVMDGPVMDPEIYGPMVTSIKAEWWSWPILAHCVVYILGIKINGNWRWSPALRAYGALFHMITLSFLALGSFTTKHLDPFAVQTAMAAVCCGWFFCLNVADLYRAILRKGPAHG